MRFGKISYLNLAPFDVFIKKYPTSSGFRAFLNKKKNYPARLNKEFLFKRIDAGFISSIAGLKANKTKSGIISYGAVWSVLALPNESKYDYQSASSNALSRVLGIDGEILIGDRALKYKLSNKPCIDLGAEWFKKQHLPFVFGLLCYNKYGNFYNKISNDFNAKRQKIPYYLLQQYSLESGIKMSEIKQYLTRIHYQINPKAQIALNRFYRALRIKGIKSPRRF